MKTRVRIYRGDCRKVLVELINRGLQVDTCITDTPYHLASIVKRFGKADAAPAKFGADGRFTRAGAGFIGQTWDGTDAKGIPIAHDPEVWRLIHNILVPGGFCFAFSSPKTGHRMAVAMEDAGLIIHPFIAWLYAQGFPKAHAVGKAWPGWYHGGQALNPACDPIYVAQRPRSEKTNALNMARWGAGAFNIEASRVPPRFAGPREAAQGGLARWPSNVAHDGSPAVLGAFPPAQGGFSPAGYFNEFPPALYHRKATKAEKVGDHPTQKPIGLLRWLAAMTTTPGGTILDPFAGHGSMGVAARQEGFNSILIEQDQGYVDVIRKRLDVKGDLLG